MGLPIGPGVCIAWVDRDWSSGSKAIGFSARVGGALVGAWLGFHATTELLALVTAITGATVGGNLTLVVLDIAWSGQIRDRFAATTAGETLEMRPSTG